MKLVGIVLVVLGIAVIYLLGYLGQDPKQAIETVRTDLRL